MTVIVVVETEVVYRIEVEPRPGEDPWDTARRVGRDLPDVQGGQTVSNYAYPSFADPADRDL